MASLASACRNSARAMSRAAVQHGHRGFKTSARLLAAHNLNMPAMSPTMTEGNIASWKVKEGDSFSTGDVILEIETDKAQMDVEAQDDGVLAKIIQPDGAKSVQVGTRIAVLAESGDDLATLEIPPEDAPGQSAPKQEQPKEQPPPPKSKSTQGTSASGAKPQTTSGKTGPQKYPLYPSVQHLLKENGLSKDDAEKIPATGPQGRLLKGDVLAYLGKVEQSYPSELAGKFDKLAHLDLSNIKLAKPPAPPKEEKKELDQTPVEELDTEIAVPVSLLEVLKTQKRLKETLDMKLPLSFFITRAIELANQDLPARKTAPTADDLFNSVLGLDQVKSKSSTGHFIPQVSAFPVAAPKPSSAGLPKILASRPKSDILDILAGKSAPTKRTVSSPESFVTETRLFSLSVPKDDVNRATVFLGRVKEALEEDSALLVL